MDNFTTELAILDSHVDDLVKRTQVNEQKLKQFQKMETDFLSRTSLSELIEFSVDDCISSFGLDAVSLVLLNNNGELKDFLEEGGFLMSQHRNLFFVEDDVSLQQLFGKTRQIYVVHSNKTCIPGSMQIVNFNQSVWLFYPYIDAGSILARLHWAVLTMNDLDHSCTLSFLIGWRW